MLFAADADGALAVLLATDADVKAIHAIVRLNGVRPIAFVHLCDVPHLAVVNHFVLGQTYQPVASLVVAPISVCEVVAAASAEDKSYHR